MLTIDESINRLYEMVDQMSEGYVCNLAHGGSGDIDFELDMEAMQNVAEACRNRGAELKAAIEDLKLYAGCKVCKHGDFKFTKECMDCSYDNNNWEWRGVCPENTKEEPQT